MSPSDPTHEPSSRQAFTPSAVVPVSFGSSPITTSTAAPARKPVITGLDRNRAIHPSRKTARSRNSAPVTSVIAATSSAACFPPSPVSRTAPPATAARDELGPVEICCEVPNRAYRIAPAAAAYSPFCSGTPAMPAYPRFLGTISAVTAIPAATSPRRNARS